MLFLKFKFVNSKRKLRNLKYIISLKYVILSNNLEILLFIYLFNPQIIYFILRQYTFSSVVPPISIKLLLITPKIWPLTPAAMHGKHHPLEEFDIYAYRSLLTLLALHQSTPF